MKTLREYIDQLDEISRRDFLKGAGAAVAGAALGRPTGAKADWEKEPDITDRMTDEIIRKWKNISTNGQATLRFLHSSGKPGWAERQLSLWRNGGRWVQQRGSTGHDFGRIRIDNDPVLNIVFSWMSNTPSVVMITHPNGFNEEYQKLVNSILTAKQRILIDASSIGGDIYEFNPNIREDVKSLEESEPEDPISRIDRLFRES